MSISIYSIRDAGRLAGPVVCLLSSLLRLLPSGR
jgi:hypothetical protein